MKNQFVDMHTLIPEGEVGTARTSYIQLSKEDVFIDNLHNIFNGFSQGVVEPGKYTRLHVNGTLYMSDTPMERQSNSWFVSRANGRVLIAGLGIGLVLPPILAKENVSEVVIVERSQDVIDLISPHFDSPKLKIIQADVFEWKPAKGEKFDTIYFDIWPDVCTDNLEQIAKLHQRFKFYVNRTNSEAFMDSWQRDFLKYERRREKNSLWW